MRRGTTLTHTTDRPQQNVVPVPKNNGLPPVLGSVNLSERPKHEAVELTAVPNRGIDLGRTLMPCAIDSHLLDWPPHMEVVNKLGDILASKPALVRPPLLWVVARFTSTDGAFWDKACLVDTMAHLTKIPVDVAVEVLRAQWGGRSSVIGATGEEMPMKVGLLRVRLLCYGGEDMANQQFTPELKRVTNDVELPVAFCNGPAVIGVNYLHALKLAAAFGDKPRLLPV
eukprot:TRINITY_DN99432_c0_g1_i1.p1 TRINITY_DN99432_c0_g1~~TRINITY_DN99432_c0_g1_i1.p1  ORF type:complete len:227 (-),score=26.70 TRINITY_DN99432_c0_g1_i1:27-707(-)